MENLTLSAPCDAVLRGEPVKVAHVERVPAHRDLFGGRRRAHYRAIVVWPDGRWANDVLVTELEPVPQPA